MISVKRVFFKRKSVQEQYRKSYTMFNKDLGSSSIQAESL